MKNQDVPPFRILLVEDEPHIAQGLVFNLEHEGFLVTHVETGEEALRELELAAYDLLVLDLMLPGISGLEVCRRVREKYPHLAILMVTALGEEHDRIAGLAEGADDYLPKPFNLDEFLLRVKAILRRVQRANGSAGQPRIHTFGDNRVDLQGARAETPRGSFDLTELEVKMLKVFFEREEELVTRRELLEKVWGMAPDTETRTLDNFIVRLRKYFEKNPARPVHFRTVRGRGYRFHRS
ncbi:response regulator transcription factor [Geoalkalibacter halelectricus]|uniref:Response regulator transcription factor n=1 Tax=Geoalkalibacter halelectricus TaxID=2847045 RepID=A0ABY5ZP34_9BACT|nr:response regulator transcription factor [Geoalkalibacter halelectricus]MDO3377369.1 response regulator transcription factor [Geoalkalibacter halelectricus]UWZ80866.1 response regulator transcription factor [Geoalkalibacter halelectricus]